MQICLTSGGLFLARPEEELLRDWIPLHEILEVKKSNENSDIKPVRNLDKEASVAGNRQQASMLNIKFNLLVDDESQADQSTMNVIQIRTVENGYNSGRTYYLSTDSVESCQAWINSVRSAVDRAILLKLAGPGFLKKAQYRLGKFYHSNAVQSAVALLIFFSFLCNVLQSELVPDLPEGSDSNHTDQTAFAALEMFFTFAFVAELLVNIFSHFLWPFFKVISPRCRNPPAHAKLANNESGDEAISDSLSPGRGINTRISASVSPWRCS